MKRQVPAALSSSQYITTDAAQWRDHSPTHSQLNIADNFGSPTGMTNKSLASERKLQQQLCMSTLA